jgi:phage terminase Nu1 subunit (DNA packaging protein)
MPRPAHIIGQIANRGEMAGILAISPTTLDRYVQAGCPFLEKGSGRREYRFNTAEVIRWVLARGATPAGGHDDTRRRYNQAAAELKEFQLAQKRGSMIRVEDAAAIIQDELANVRSRLLAIPYNVASKVVGVTDPAAIEAALRDEVIAALSELTADDRERSPFRVGAE